MGDLSSIAFKIFHAIQSTSREFVILIVKVIFLYNLLNILL